VGADDQNGRYAQELVSEMGDGVVFTGRLSRAEVMTLNQHASLFVLPSLHEGLSIAALEAIRAGTPVLLSDIEANRDIGLPDQNHFETGSVEALARKLQHPPSEFAVPPEFEVARFDWDRIADHTLEQFSRILRNGELLVQTVPDKGTRHV
jgi:glycosyltransferase involved in cell wall biosynthesis